MFFSLSPLQCQYFLVVFTTPASVCVIKSNRIKCGLMTPTVVGTIAEVVLNTLPGVCLPVDRFCHRDSIITMQDDVKKL